jgi:hypothetical protein
MALLVPLVHKYCSCTDEFFNPTHLSIHQKAFEELKLKGFTNREALDKMNIVRLCCRESIFNPPTLFLTKENENRIRDETNSFKIENKDTADILPEKEFPAIPT